MTDVIAGIDLGTTSYSVAIYSNNVAQPLENLRKATTTPCYVAYNLLDTVSETPSARYPNTESCVVYHEPKKLNGRRYEDQEVQAFLEWLPYCGNTNAHRDIFIQRGPKRIISTPADMYQSTLKYIKESIEKAMGQVSRIQVVITVPPAFTREQRNATLAAAKSVGFQVLELLDDPTAIALDYFSEHETLKKGDLFLVYDLGASNFKYGIFEVTDNSFQLVSASSDTEISGQQFDLKISEYFCNEIRREYRFEPNANLIRDVKLASDKVKRSLSGAKQTSLFLRNNIGSRLYLTLFISQYDFEEMAKNLFCRTVSIVDKLLNDHKVTKKAIKKIILHGGLSRTPKIRQLLFEHFGDIISEELIYEDSSVAKGAALHAAELLRAHSPQKRSS